MKYQNHCEVCGIDFMSYKGPKTLCNMCATNGEKTKEVTCKKCGKSFYVDRNPNDENRFRTTKFCPDCSGRHCRICKAILTSQEEIKSSVCNNCKEQGKTKNRNRNYKSKINIKDSEGKVIHLCTKCQTPIEVENIPGTNKYLPKGKKRKLCDKCYKEFMSETKNIVCVSCGKIFSVKRSETDAGFLLRDYCDDCYNKKYHPKFKIKICKKCGKEFKIYPNSDGKFTENKQYCEICLPLALKEGHSKTCLEKYGIEYSCLLPQCQEARGVKESKINKKFIELLNSNSIKTESEWYDKTNSRHYDIYLPDQDILIEINPTYTHSTLGNHFNGFKKLDIEKIRWMHYYRTKDIDKRVIHVWDWDDWNKIIDLVKPKIKYYARNFNVEKVTEQDAKAFLIQNHIQGNCRRKEINLGLYNKDNQLMQLMVFGKPRYNKNYQWELLRLCSRSDCMIVGGAEKLFKHFIQFYKPESIISYCDISKFTGDVYERLGFKLKKQTSPSKHWSKNSEHITDNLLRQRGFDQLFKTNYGKGTDNEKLMIQNGWRPIYDCGQYTYLWRKGENIKNVRNCI